MSGGTCQPGDITVRTGERGFVVGYVLKINGDGLNWRRIDSVEDFQSAVRLARSLAREIGVQAWIEGPDDTFEPISLTVTD
jgi:hypothetical protein